MREVVLTAASLALTGAVVANAYYQKHQFYPSVVYLTKSSPSMAVLYVQAFVCVILLGKLMRKVFFGQLRAAETEHLIERSWYAVTETCLAFTVFRDDFSPRFVAQFTLLLFLKCFHWLTEDRIDYMERSPVLSYLFHFRAVSLLFFLGLLDAFLVHVAYNTTMQTGASVQLVFGFEYAILLTIIVTMFMKYTLHVIDLQSENPWDNKAVYLLYTELITGFIKGVLYVCFMVIMIKVHTFPLFAIRPMYLTLRSFKKSLSDVIMSRRAIRNMNTLYPDATPEELAQEDNVCIICREEMVTGCKKLPCNHIFHTSCLRSWFQRQQTCPTCRMDVLRPPPPPATQAQGPVPGIQPQGIPPMANIPPGMPPMPGMFPGWPPANVNPVPPPAGAQTPFGTSATAGSAAAAGPATSQDSSQQPATSFPFPDMFTQMPPPFMCPPYMMPPVFGMPFGPPLVPPGADLSSLGLEELRAVEVQERQNVESRVAMLRTVHSLLDAAISQLNQYTQMVDAQNQPSSTKTASTTTGAEAAAAAAAATAATVTGEHQESVKQRDDSTVGPSVSSQSPSVEQQDSVDSHAQPETVGSANDHSEIRRRRLEKFVKDEDKKERTDT